MRRFLVWLLRFLIVVTVALASMLTSMRFAIHGREVAVPKVGGVTLAEAAKIAQANGLVLNEDQRFYSAEVPEGKIISQSPPPGSQVRRGARLRVATSLGPQTVSIPEVVGQSQRAAEINVKRRGLELGTVATIPQEDVAPEQAVPELVVGQNPPANAGDVMSPKVDLLVGAPKSTESAAFVMPDFVGMRFGAASQSISGAGLKVGRVGVESIAPVAPALPQAAPNNGSAGSAKNGASATNGNHGTNGRAKPTPEMVVVRQNPAPGARVNADTVVAFEVRPE